jgi:hypothetical protein
MKATRFAASFFAAGLLAALLLAPAAGAQTMSERARAAKKIKAASTRKVWTNEDLQRLEGGWGVNVVGTSIRKPEEAAAPAAKAAAPAPAGNFYSDMSMEEREQWIAVFEREISEAETELIELRSRALTAPTEAERATAAQQMTGLEQKREANRLEIELIRNTPPPKPAKPGAKPKAPSF